MKEAVGGISLFQIVVLFLLIFTAIMCLTINHSKAYEIKDEIINILENVESASSNTVSLNNDVLDEIREHLVDTGYRITGKCPNGYIGYNRNGIEVSDGTASFCVKPIDVAQVYNKDAKDKCKNKCTITSDAFPKMIYYDIIVFYQLDVPFLNQIFNLKLYGSTKILFG